MSISGRRNILSGPGRPLADCFPEGWSGCRKVRLMRVIAVLLGLITLVGAALAQTGPATSDKPSAAASPSATAKTGSERNREESVAFVRFRGDQQSRSGAEIAEAISDDCLWSLLTV